MLLLLEVGRRLALRRLATHPEAPEGGRGTIEGSVFALFGLLIAFTFSGAGSRFDAKRQLISEEANAVGTAYLRLELLPEASQPALRASFRDYLRARLETYRDLTDLAAAKAGLARSGELQRAIWTAAVAASRQEGAHPDAGKLLLPALNEMIDITTTRTMATRIHPPRIIYALLFLLGLGCALLAGYGMTARKSRSWLHILGFVTMTVIAIYVTLDLEYPRVGLLRIDAYDEVLVELLESMK
jgi:hypothetical protein